MGKPNLPRATLAHASPPRTGVGSQGLQKWGHRGHQIAHQRCSVPLEEKEVLLRGQAWVGEGRTCGRISKGDA